MQLICHLAEDWAGKITKVTKRKAQGDLKVKADYHIFLWINPRNLSTAFTKCVSFMDGACIWHEPYASSFFKEMFLDPEMIRKYPQLSTFKTQFAETSDQLESFDHYFDGGNLKPLSEFE